jgi:DNA-binding NarL/FixJ family response regulator
VIISMYSYQKFVDELRAIGVAGYLLKSASPSELIACLNSVVAGIPYFDIKLTGKAAALHQEDEFVKRFKLSTRELEIIVLLKQGLANPEIAKLLFLSEETIKTHRKNIYYKLGINNLAGLIQFANEQGL